jgi:hypothetical protein
MKPTKDRPRMYNQAHIPRAATPGKKRVSVYISWSYPAESNRDLTQLDNRYSSMAEVRRVAWPSFEKIADPLVFPQGIAGSLELFFRAWLPFQDVVSEATGHSVPVYQRVDHAGFILPIDERILEDTDVLFVFGLDHNVTRQDASSDEVKALQKFLERDGTRLIIGPHHDVGESDDPEVRQAEYLHHGDALVPRQQRFGNFTRMLMTGLEIPVINRYGLRPAVVKGTKQVAPLHINQEADSSGYLEGVTNFNFHMHLPHYEILPNGAGVAKVLAKQTIDMSAPPHPFVEAGNTEFNTLVQIPPHGKRRGDILVCDSTVFSALFGADESLKRFWQNVVK